jgi:hypothetical protein
MGTNPPEDRGWGVYRFTRAGLKGVDYGGGEARGQ